MKYSVNDIVLIKKNLQLETIYGKHIVINRMITFASEIGYVAKIIETEPDGYNLEGNNCLWTDEMIECSLSKSSILKSLCSGCNKECSLRNIQPCDNLKELMFSSLLLFSKDFRMPARVRVREGNELISIQDRSQLKEVLYSANKWHYISGYKVFENDTQFNYCVNKFFENYGRGLIVMLMYNTKRVRLISPKETSRISGGSKILTFEEWKD
ncbi:MAG: hypothetical protein M0P71_00760 [Melioribacteraceae bacterium]|nr:hypothetical protein [Melioribacteraceae bacterium]